MILAGRRLISLSPVSVPCWVVFSNDPVAHPVISLAVVTEAWQDETNEGRELVIPNTYPVIERGFGSTQAGIRGIPDVATGVEWAVYTSLETAQASAASMRSD